MDTWRVVKAIVILLVGLGLIGWWLFRWLNRTRDDPVRLVVKWVISAVVLAAMLVYLVPWILRGGMAGAFGIVYVAACGAVMAILWTGNIAEYLARPFENLYTGGDVAPDPAPFYSIAEAQRKKGDYARALAEIERQLERFPTDFHGQMLKAEIQAENLRDMPAAQATVDLLLNQSGHLPVNVAYALNSLADWHLEVARDFDSARLTLERIGQLLPDTEHAQLAAQRLAHLSSGEWISHRQERRRIELRKGDDRFGLRASPTVPEVEEDPVTAAQDCIRRLAEHPQDADTREQLAVLYAERLDRMDLAKLELEQLITTPHQPSKLVVHWLNLLADLQIQRESDLAGATASLQRIIDLFPGAAAAENASRRLALLPNEIKAKSKSRVVELGSYEQDIGLKRGPFQRS